MLLSMDTLIKKKIPRRRRLTKEDKKLVRKIRSLRIERKITQEELSERLGYNLSYMAYIETYRSGLSLPTVYKVSKILGVKLKELFDF